MSAHETSILVLGLCVKSSFSYCLQTWILSCKPSWGSGKRTVKQSSLPPDLGRSTGPISKLSDGGSLIYIHLFNQTIPESSQRPEVETEEGKAGVEHEILIFHNLKKKNSSL